MTTRRLLAVALLLLLAPLLHGRGASSTPRIVLEGDGVLYFTHYEGGLWRTDGTAGGTRRIHAAGVGEAVVVNGRVYVLTEQQNVPRLLAIDDTGAAKEIRSFEKMSVSGLTAAGSRLFFFTRETGMPGCVRLWTSDGTAAGTRIVAALFTDDASPLATTPERLLFKLYRGPFEYGYRTNYDTWSSDGT
ncbi:MAG TPA: hypothetical protein VEU30_09045, partial [Thermoanaerobaculia bacterium]|nr:hypothetical protein [Thermoanaerobaculia bacterium]